MYPFVHIGVLTLSSYKLITALAATLGTWLIFRRVTSIGYTPAAIARCIFFAFAGGFGAIYLVQFFINAWRMTYGDFSQHEGLSVIWGIGGVALGAFIACRRAGVRWLRAFDRAVAPLILAQALARWGCFAHGCCGGKPTDSWFAMDMPNEYGVWAHRYPTQLLASGINFIIFLVLIGVERYARTRAKQMGLDHHWPFDGFLVALYFILFGLKRFFIAFLRESATPLWGGWISLMHLQALAFIGIGIGMIYFLHPSHRNSSLKRSVL